MGRVLLCLYQQLRQLLYQQLRQMSLLIAEVSLLEPQGVIDWDTQLWSLITHIMFVDQFFVSATLDYCNCIQKSSHFNGSMIGMAVIFLVACMAYAPIFLAMNGFQIVTKISEFRGFVEENMLKEF